MDIFDVKSEFRKQAELPFVEGGGNSAPVKREKIDASDPKALSKLFAGYINCVKKVHRTNEANLVEQGIRVFPVQTQNDTESIEADYGAPVLGLSSFSKILTSDRYFRYDQVEKIRGVYYTHANQSRSIGRSLKSKGYKVFHGVDETHFPCHIAFFNGGVTKAFNDLVIHIVYEFTKMQKARLPYLAPQSGAILVPVPTYGLFHTRMEEIIKDRDIKIIPVYRHDDGSVDQISLKAQIRECKAEDRRIIGYYDCNPHNPTGYIRGREETEEIAQILLQASDNQKVKDIVSLAPYLRNDENRDALFLLNYYRENTQGAITIIDDMAYEGLEMISSKKPYSFSQVSYHVSELTAVLKGISKIGLPGMRIAMMIANADLASHFSERHIMREFSANSLGVDILTARYGVGDFSPLFRSHTEKLRRRHQARALSLHAFFRGIDHVDGLNVSAKNKLIKSYASYSGVSIHEATNRLRKGLPNFYIPEGPESGFFQRINCESLRDKSIAIKRTETGAIEYDEINTGYMLYYVFKAFGIRVVPAVSQGGGDSLVVRISFSISEDDFFHFYDKMREMHGYFFGTNPEVQLDLFRDISNEVSL